MARRPSPPKPPEMDLSLLSPEEQQALQAEVQQEVEEERRERAKKAYKDRLRAEAKRDAGLAEDHEEVTIDLAPYCDRILLDNVAYLQGMTYNVPVGRAQVMREIMQRTWGHQSEIDGKSENFYRRTRGQRVVPHGNSAAVVTTSSLLRA